MITTTSRMLEANARLVYRWGSWMRNARYSRWKSNSKPRTAYTGTVQYLGIVKYEKHHIYIQASTSPIDVSSLSPEHEQGH
jgi:hypothetical protein